MAKITKIGVGGFKSIKDLQPLELRPANLLIGPNGAGKSNLISFLNLLKVLPEETLQEYVGRAGGAETLLHYGAKVTPAMWAAIEFTGKAGEGRYFFWLTATVTDSLVFRQEQVIYAGARSSGQQVYQLGSGHKESLLMAGENQFLEIRELLAGIQIFHFHDTSETALIRKHGYVEDSRHLRNDAGNLAPFLYGLKRRRSAYYRRIIEAIRQVAPFFDDFVLMPKAETNDTSILLNWKDRDSEHLFGPHQLSDGTLRAMALITLLLQPEEELPPLIVLDEPEIGMHPYAIEVLASLIRGASVHRPLIVATQSVSLMNCFDPEDIIVVSRKDGQSHFERQNSESLAAWLKEYDIGELWEKNLIGGNSLPMTRLYVVSEGLTETNFVRDILAPHVEQRWPTRLNVQAPNMRGKCRYADVKKLIRTLLGNPASEVFVTTMIDLYQLPRDFPGHAECSGYEDSRKRVDEMERFLSEDVRDHRFIPHLQLHEFEALILTDALSLAKYYPNRKEELGRLARTVEKDFRSPEEVDRLTPPSWRLRTAVPEYQKALFGIAAIMDLGLERIRGKCKHFDAWLQRVEHLLDY